MNDYIKFTKVPKGKEQDRLYHTPELKNVKVDKNSPFMKELDRLIKGEIKEMDLDKVEKEWKEYKGTNE